MASRKEERERLRIQREQHLAETARQERKRLLLGYIVAGVISLAVLAGIVAVVVGGGGGDEGSNEGVSEEEIEAAHLDLQVGIVDGKEPDTRDGTDPAQGGLVDLTKAAEAAGCDLREGLDEEGNTHIGDAKEPDYETEPATSGNHSPEPQADGAYAEPLSPLHYVHALEHGRIAIVYSPDLPEAAQLELKGVFDFDPEGMLLFPGDPDMPYEVAAVAWTNLIGCDSYEGVKTLDILRAFRDKWRGRGPEAVPL